MNDLNGTALAALAAALAPYIAQEMQKLTGSAQGNPTAQTGAGFGAQQQAQPFVGQQQPAQANPFGQQPPAQQVQPTVTPDMIQQLITPLVQNEQVKAALMAQMTQMGIQNLPDATPAQLPELYQRFKQVEEQARAAGLLGAPAQTGII